MQSGAIAAAAGEAGGLGWVSLEAGSLGKAVLQVEATEATVVASMVVALEEAPAGMARPAAAAAAAPAVKAADWVGTAEAAMAAAELAVAMTAVEMARKTAHSGVVR